MVSFVCDACQDTVKKAKLLQHFKRCRTTFSCVDCLNTFDEVTFKSHNSCISEEEKTDRNFNKNKQKNKQNTKNKENNQKQQEKKSKDNASTEEQKSNDVKGEPKKEDEKSSTTPSTPEKKDKNNKTSTNNFNGGKIILDDELEKSLSEMDDGAMTPSSKKKRKRSNNDDGRNINFSPEKKKIKTRYQLDEQLDSNLKKKMAQYEHLKLNKIIKKILKKAPNSTMKYGQLRKEFETKALSKVRDDLLVLFESIVKNFKVEGEDVKLK